MYIFMFNKSSHHCRLLPPNFGPTVRLRQHSSDNVLVSASESLRHQFAPVSHLVPSPLILSVCTRTYFAFLSLYFVSFRAQPSLVFISFVFFTAQPYPTLLYSSFDSQSFSLAHPITASHPTSALGKLFFQQLCTLTVGLYTHNWFGAKHLEFSVLIYSAPFVLTLVIFLSVHEELT
jgi:hypothetical protein